MQFKENEIEILHPVPISLEVKDVIGKLKSRKNRQSLIDQIKKLFEETSSLWAPRAMYSWLPVHHKGKKQVMLGQNPDNSSITFSMGHSATFMRSAIMAFVGIYTAGPELEVLSKSAANEQRYLDSYILETIGLSVLDKTRSSINTHIELKAAEKGWNVGPFLSPGSVHGWELEEQTILSSYFDLSKIDVTCSENGVLSPFNSISCVIGIGPNYENTHVGSTCQVCSSRDSCTLRND